MGFAATLEEIANDLQAAGLSASLDPADVNPPGVIVKPDAQIPGIGKLCGSVFLRVSLILVVPDAPTVVAMRNLEALWDRVAPAAMVAGLTVTTDEQTFERIVMPDDPTGLPALRVTTLTEVAITTTVERVSR